MSQSSSYANVARNAQYPKREQAVLVDSLDGVTINEYTRALTKVTPITNILFISRISNSRVCAYLASKQIVEELIAAKAKITIGTTELSIRPFMTPAKRVIFSNVCPIIPHEIIESKLALLNIRTMSKMTFIRASVNEPGGAHIMSFRRQIYVNPDDVSSLPDSMQLNYDGSNFWIYISTENPSCFICKQEGHLARSCTETPSYSPSNPTTTNQLSEEIIDGDTLKRNRITSDNAKETHAGLKRALSQST